MEEIRQNEAWATSFTFLFYGVGRASSFENACDKMGLNRKCLTTIGSSKEEIRNMMGVVSKSASSSNGGNSVSF